MKVGVDLRLQQYRVRARLPSHLACVDLASRWVPIGGMLGDQLTSHAVPTRHTRPSMTPSHAALTPLAQAVLLEVEEKVRAAPQTPLSYLYNALSAWRIELTALADLTRRVSSGEVRGARLLDLLEGPGVVGIPLVEAAFATYVLAHCWHANPFLTLFSLGEAAVVSESELLTSVRPRCLPPVFSVAVPCRRVLANQLSAWLLHGLLLDDAAEFFVQPPAGGEAAVDSWQSHIIQEDLLPASIPLRVADKVCAP